MPLTRKIARIFLGRGLCAGLLFLIEEQGGREQAIFFVFFCF